MEPCLNVFKPVFGTEILQANFISTFSQKNLFFFAIRLYFVIIVYVGNLVLTTRLKT